MKIKIALFFFLFSALIVPVHGKINAYLSFEFEKGQSQSVLSHGSFQNAQFGLIFTGDISPKIDYISEVLFQQDATVDINQALVRFKSSESFALKFGLYLVPFGKYNQSNRPHQTMLVKLPLHIEKMFPLSWRDIGILLEGKFSGFVYSAYLGNGLSEAESLSKGQQFTDNNPDKGKGVRLGLALSQEIEIGYSYYIGKGDEGDKRNIDLHGLDLSWISRGFQILSEYARAQVENPQNFPTGKAEGYFVQVSFDMDRFRPVVSYQWVKYRDHFHGRGFIKPDYFGAGISEEKNRWAVGLEYIASPNVYFKLEYDFNTEKEFEIRDNTFSAQLALIF